MTVAWKDGECWRFEDGAPAGPPIDVTVPSSRDGHSPYRVLRDDVSGVVIHSPACPAWTHRRRCRHLTRAFALAEEPEATFVADVIDAWVAGGWSDEHRSDFAAYVYQAAQEAQAQRKAISDYERRQARPKVTHEQAVAELGGG